MSRARDLANLGDGITTTDLPDITADKLDVGQIGGRRNLIINGAMQVAQRGTSTTGISSGASYYTSDRWSFSVGTGGTWTATQSTTAPEGFSNSYKVECTTANASLSAGSLVVLQQAIEGQNLQHLKYGTANAETITMSFWVRSAKTGTYIVEIYGVDNARQISKSYTINSANTWEKKSIVFEGDTVGSLDNDNNVSFWCVFWLAAGTDFTSGTLSTTWTANTNANRVVGQVNLADTVGNDFYLTGVQLEVGSVATPFEHRSYGEELALCQRYAWAFSPPNGANFFSGMFRNTSNAYIYAKLPMPMRATPSSISVNSVSDFGVVTYGYLNSACNSIVLHTAGTQEIFLDCGTAQNTFRTADPAIMYSTTGNGVIVVEAEL